MADWPRIGDGKAPYTDEETANEQDRRAAENPNAAPDIRPMSAMDAPNDGREPTGPAAPRRGRPRKAVTAPVVTTKPSRRSSAGGL